MEYKDFLAAEYKLHVASDKKYQAHLKEIQTLTKRQVVAQEAMLKQVVKVISAESTGRKPAKTRKNAPKEEA